MVRIRMYVAASYPATSITSSCFILYTATIQDSSPLGRRLGRRCAPLPRLYLRMHACTGVRSMVRQAIQTQADQLQHLTSVLELEQRRALQQAYRRVALSPLSAGVDPPFGAVKVVCCRQAPEEAKAQKDK